MLVQRLADARRRCRGRRSRTRRRTAAARRPASCRAQRGEIAHQRLRAVRRVARVRHAACSCDRAARWRRAAHRATRRSALRSSRARAASVPRRRSCPASHARRGSWKIVRPDREAAAGAARTRAARSPRASVDSGCVEPEQQRRRGNTDRARRSARRPPAIATAPSARASTTRDRCRGCTGASSRAARCRSSRGTCLRRDDLEQQFVAARLHGVVQRAHLRFLLEPMHRRDRRGGTAPGT